MNQAPTDPRFDCTPFLNSHGQLLLVAHFHKWKGLIPVNVFMRRFRPSCVFGSLCLLLWLMAAMPAGAEHRGLWVVAHSLQSSQSIDQVVNYAHSLRITDLFLQVRSRGDAFYQTKLAPRAEILSSQDPRFDPLGYAIRRASAAGIRVHAWMNVFLLWSNPRAPKERSHLIIRNSSWLSQHGRASRLQTGMDIVREARRNNLEGAYLSPGHPAALRYLQELFREVVDRYPIQGLHLDYIRYPGESYGFEEPMTLGFQRRYGVKPAQLMYESGMLIDKYGEGHYNRLLRAWDQYRCDQITSLVQSVRTIVKRKNQSLLLSMAVRPDLDDARVRFGQDWRHWAKTGLMDMALPMNYTPDLQTFMDLSKNMLQELSRNKIWMGVATYNQSGREAASKIIQMRTLGLSHFVLFSYDSSRKFPELAQLLK